jgi:hypothetical protein
MTAKSGKSIQIVSQRTVQYAIIIIGQALFNEYYANYAYRQWTLRYLRCTARHMM